MNNTRILAAAISLCVALAILELAHPGGTDSTVVDALWLRLHIALTIGYGLLTWFLWNTARIPAAVADRHRIATALFRAALIVFVLANTTFLLIDGVFPELRAGTDPVSASPVLANITGAAWCFVLLSLAAARAPAALDRPATLLLVLTWFAFIAGATPLQASPLVSRAAAVVSAAWFAYRGGVSAVPSALLAFAAVLRQHVGPEAALGLLCVAAALGLSVRTVR